MLKVIRLSSRDFANVSKLTRCPLGSSDTRPLNVSKIIFLRTVGCITYPTARFSSAILNRIDSESFLTRVSSLSSAACLTLTRLALTPIITLSFLIILESSCSSSTSSSTVFNISGILVEWVVLLFFALLDLFWDTRGLIVLYLTSHCLSLLQAWISERWVFFCSWSVSWDTLMMDRMWAAFSSVEIGLSSD